VKTYAFLTQFVPIAGHLPSMFLATVVNSCPFRVFKAFPCNEIRLASVAIIGANSVSPPLASQLQLPGRPLACDPFAGRQR